MTLSAEARLFGRRQTKADWAELAQDARAVRAYAVARIESRLSLDLERIEHIQVSTEASVESPRHSVAEHATDLARAVDQLACTCALLVERVEAEQLERRSLVEAVARLARQFAPSIDAQPTATRARVIGGTVLASAEIPHDSEISLVDHDMEASEDHCDARAGTEVWDNFEKHRVDDFQVNQLVKRRPHQGMRLGPRRSTC